MEFEDVDPVVAVPHPETRADGDVSLPCARPVVVGVFSGRYEDQAAYGLRTRDVLHAVNTRLEALALPRFKPVGSRCTRDVLHGLGGRCSIGGDDEY